ncbi:MAG: hypothetical protein IJ306_02540 [Oscillospiraceae bacterium]|nr:hypothetical protein [Oscillospiraceae bacterium]
MPDFVPCGVCGRIPVVEERQLGRKEFKYGKNAGDFEIRVYCPEGETPHRDVAACGPSREKIFESVKTMWNEFAENDMRRTKNERK